MQSPTTESIAPAAQATASAFLLKRSRFLPTLNLTVEEYEHVPTGALHFHLASDNPENVFLVALRTVPMDSTGVAHILEHTALCGSRRFPVRDPFFMMIRRSMNTFMNAFTSSDWTAYPFASQNRKDFNNLLEVYLDAVFFSNLDELDFAQEGHRLEFQQPDDPQSPLEYKGVVFNEMKGAMSSSNSYIWQLLSAALFPTTTYHYNSGGDPEYIPDLSYAELKAFYQTHYHPSNAIFMTYGDIPAQEHQARFQALALKDFDKLDVHIAVGDEQRFAAPRRITAHYPLDEDDVTDKSHVLMAWLLGKSTSLEELYKAQLLSAVLLDNSASPLLQVLETSSLGRSPSPLCGLEDSYREMSFICGLEGCAPGLADDVERLILDTLREVADTGIAQDKVEAALHTLELHAREISGDSYPYGLQLILSALSTATHRGDPIELLDIDPVLEKLAEDIKDPQYIPRLIRELLLDNPHRLTLSVDPDTGLSEREAQRERERLDGIQATLDDAEREAIVARALALLERQNRTPDAEILPKVELSDVPAEVKWPEGSTQQLATASGPCKLTRYAQGTNGLSYQQVILDLPALSTEHTDLLPYYTSCMTEVGIGNRSYLDVQAQQAAVSGGIDVYTSMRNKVGTEQDVQGYLVLSSKALYRKQAELTELLHDTLHGCRFDETARLHELMQQILGRKEQSITQQGHSLAMGAACSRMSPLSWLGYQSGGLEGIRQLKQLVKNLENPDRLNDFAAQLADTHRAVLQGKPQFLLIAEENAQDALLEDVRAVWQNANPSAATPAHFTLPALREQTNEAWLTSTQVNFCAMAFPSVTPPHPDAAALTVLAGFLRNGFLHRAIREQGGAYGGGASQDSSSASFRFFSYRDPRLSETLDDFRRSIDWMLDNPHEYSQLEEAILGVISSLDKPASPAGSAKQAFHNELFGRTKAQRAEFRRQVLAVSIDDLKAVTARYLDPAKASLGIVSHKGKQKELEGLRLALHQL
ncbi:MAG TPA: insulinase family protein [Hyphomicrobiales bacterium]|nr:insulinase family protein [Hyphomicrobiales bacterium]